MLFSPVHQESLGMDTNPLELRTVRNTTEWYTIMTKYLTVPAFNRPGEKYCTLPPLVECGGRSTIPEKPDETVLQVLVYVFKLSADTADIFRGTARREAKKRK